MWKLAFLVAAWLVHASVNGLHHSSDKQNPKEELEFVYDKIAEEMLLSLGNAHSWTTQRKKREIKNLDVYDDAGVYRLRSITPVSKLCSPAIYSTFLDIKNETYAICISPASDSPATVRVGIYKEHQWNVFHWWYVANPTTASAFHYKNYLYVLVADREKDDGIDLVKIDIISKQVIVDHTVNSRHATSLAIWKMKIDRNYHMAVANSNGKDDFGQSSEVYIYEWMGTYFDRYSSFQAYNVTDIEPFHIYDASYLAVANYKKGENSRVDSAILKYNIDQKRWVSHQKIQTYGAMDWEFFSQGKSLGQEFFLAVANKEDNGIPSTSSMIYKFVKDKFVPFQCLLTVSATSISALADGELFMLAVANVNDAVQIYQYDGWRFVLSGTQYTQGTMSYGVNHLTFHKVASSSKEVVILSVGNPQVATEPSVFEIGFKHENSLKEWYDKSSDWCSSTLATLESSNLDSLINSMTDVLFIDQPSIKINGNLIFENGFGANAAKTPQLTEIITQQTYDSSLLQKLADLHGRLQLIDKKLKEFGEVLQNALKVEGDQIVSSKLTFQDILFECESQDCRFDSINTNILNGEEIGNWEEQLVFLDGKRFINGTLRANNVEALNITVLGTIDGVESNRLVTKSGNHKISGRKTFQGLIQATDIEVSGLVDGIKITPSNVLLTTGHQTVTGNLTFDEIDTSWLEIDSSLNGIDLSNFYQDIVLANQFYNITGEKTFEDIVVEDLIMTPGSTINGVDLADLWANTLWKEGNQEIKAPLNFASVTLAKNLHVSFINGIDIPGPRVVTVNGFANVTAPHVFEKATKIDNLNVRGSLNGLELIPGSSELDIMLKSKEQLVTGKKVFHTIHLDADSYVNGTVDNVDLSELKEVTLHKDTTVISNRTWRFNNLVIKGPLTVAGEVAGINIQDLYKRALMLNETHIPDMTFTDIIEIDELESDNINNVNVKRDLVLKNRTQTVSGNKTFRNIILEENSFVLGSVNNVNMTILNNTLLKIGNQVIRSKKFNKNVNVKSLTVRGSINGVPLDDFITLNGSGIIPGSRLFINTTFNEIEANSLEVTGKVNGIDLDEMIKNTMTYDGAQKVTGTKTVNGTIHVAEENFLQTDVINGINLDHLWNDAVFIDIPQQITGAKTFLEEVAFDDLSFTKTVDGISSQHMENWMLRNAPQTVAGSVVFQADVSAKELEVGLINGIDLQQLNASIVKVNETNIVEGPIIFDNIISSGNITLTGTVQGIDLSEEILSKNDDLVVTSQKTFTQDLVINGNLNIDGLVDGISVADLCANTLVSNKVQNITRLTVKGDVILLGGGEIDGRLNGINIAELRETAVSSDGSEVRFSGNKSFQELVLDGPVKLQGTLGGVDLKSLNETYMSLTLNQIVNASMEFADLVINDTLSTDNFITLDGKVNGINIEDLNSRILKKTGTQHVNATYYFDEVIFASDVFVSGKVNGLDVPNGLMRQNHTNYIQSPKIFRKTVHVLGDLDIDNGKQIQGVDISWWKKKAVLKRGGNFIIDGYKIFHNLFLNDVVVHGLLDGIKISEDNLLMIYGDQVITGEKTILADVEIKGSLTVNGFINGIDINYLATATAQRDRNNTITGLKVFKKPLTIISLEAPTVAGIDVAALERNVSTKLDFSLLQNRLEEIEKVVADMEIAFNSKAVIFQYYELFQEFSIPGAYNWLYTANEDCGELLFLSDSSSSQDSCSSIRLFSYDTKTQEFVPYKKEIATSNAVMVKTLFLWNSTYLFVANQNPNSHCSGTEGVSRTTVDIYKWFNGAFERIQSLETKPVTDIVAFTDRELACLMYLELHASIVYCSRDGEKFEHHEVLPTNGGRKASVIRNGQGKIILAISADDPSPREIVIEEERSVDIYLWNSETQSFAKPVQALFSTYAQSVQLVKYVGGLQEEIFLVIAEGSLPKIHNEPRISIYKYDEASVPQFVKYQEIRDYGTLEWLSLNTRELIIFAVNSRKGEMKLYQYKGASGFVLIDTIISIGAVNAHPFIRPDPEDSINHYIAVAGPRAEIAQPTQGMDYAKILKSKVKGGRMPIH